MELVRELSLSFADDGKRVKVIILAKMQILLLSRPLLSPPEVTKLWDYSLDTRSVFKAPWGKVHLLASHFNWQEPEKFWNSWTGVTMGQRAPSLILGQ